MAKGKLSEEKRHLKSHLLMQTTLTGRIASEEVVSEKGGTHIFKSMHHLLPGLYCI